MHGRRHTTHGDGVPSQAQDTIEFSKAITDAEARGLVDLTGMAGGYPFKLEKAQKSLKTLEDTWIFLVFHRISYDFISMLFRSLGKGVVTELQVPDGHGVRGEDTGDRSGTVPGALRMLLCTSPPYVGP